MSRSHKLLGTDSIREQKVGEIGNQSSNRSRYSSNVDSDVKEAPKPFKINLLTKKNAEKSLCEICEHFATLQCSVCKVTFYCSVAHMNWDEQLHADLCPRLAVLRAPVKFSSCPDTRLRIKRQYKFRLEETYKYTYMKGRTAMVEGKFEMAICASTMATKMAKQAYGEHYQMLMSKSLLAESYLQSGNMKLAMEMMMECLRLEMVLGEIRRDVRAEVRRVEGLLAMHSMNYANAKYCFAEQIYLFAEEFNPSHIRTASGYYSLGEVFLRKGDHITARSLIRKTVEIWMAYVSTRMEDTNVDQMFQVNFNRSDGPTSTKQEQSRQSVKVGMSELFISDKTIDYCDRQEGINSLSYCYNLMSQLKNGVDLPIDYVEIEYVSACLLMIDNRLLEAKSKIQHVLARCDTHQLHDEIIFKKLLKMSKECEKKLMTLKKKKDSFSMSVWSGT